MTMQGPIGVFDSGYGGLTVLKEIVRKMPGYRYIYLGDNARAPYGTRSFDAVYRYTRECVFWLLEQGCPLVILACNTASAKALRTIQQKDLPEHYPDRRVLGVIRPSTEIIGNYSNTGHIGIMATSGTVASQSYVIEIEKFFPEIHVYQQACPIWVPLIENNEHQEPAAEYYVKKHVDFLLEQSPDIDTILLACTHYPIILPQIRKFVPQRIRVIPQGEIVAKSLAGYLQRHPEIEKRCLRETGIDFYTTDAIEDFDKKGTIFWGEPLQSKHLSL